jgi:hypothetical protein
MTDVVIVPSTPALLPSYAGIVDPFPDLRAACAEAVSWLVHRHPDAVRVVAGRPATRVADHLLTEAGFTGTVQESAAGVLVVANGSATRSEKAPGHLDERSGAFDEAIGAALRGGDPTVLRALDPGLGRELWCHDVPAFQVLGGLVDGGVRAETTYDDDPFGVQYWVVRWTCGS